NTEPQVLGVRPPARGDQQMRPCDGGSAATLMDGEGKPAPRLFHPFSPRTQKKSDTLPFESFLQFRSDFRIFAWNDLRVALNHGHMTAEAGKHLAEFQSDVPAAQD